MKEIILAFILRAVSAESILDRSSAMMAWTLNAIASQNLWSGYSDWVVHCKGVGDGRQSLRYLAPYVFRVAIGNHRIARVIKHADGTGEVVFMVRRSGTRRYRPFRVTAEEFIRRFLQHVLPTGLQKVRHYGFMHARSKVSLAWLKMLVTLTLNLVYVIEVGLDRSEPRLKQNPKCTECGAELLFIGFEVAKPQVSGMFDSS